MLNVLEYFLSNPDKVSLFISFFLSELPYLAVAGRNPFSPFQKLSELITFVIIS